MMSSRLARMQPGVSPWRRGNKHYEPTIGGAVIARDDGCLDVRHGRLAEPCAPATGNLEDSPAPEAGRTPPAHRLSVLRTARPGMGGTPLQGSEPLTAARRL